MGDGCYFANAMQMNWRLIIDEHGRTQSLRIEQLFDETLKNIEVDEHEWKSRLMSNK